MEGSGAAHRAAPETTALGLPRRHCACAAAGLVPRPPPLPLAALPLPLTGRAVLGTSGVVTWGASWRRVVSATSAGDAARLVLRLTHPRPSSDLKELELAFESEDLWPF